MIPDHFGRCEEILSYHKNSWNIRQIILRTFLLSPKTFFQRLLKSRFCGVIWLHIFSRLFQWGTSFKVCSHNPILSVPIQFWRMECNLLLMKLYCIGFSRFAAHMHSDSTHYKTSISGELDPNSGEQAFIVPAVIRRSVPSLYDTWCIFMLLQTYSTYLLRTCQWLDAVVETRN